MSIRIMSAIWDSGPEKQGHLLVLLALSDFANDQGECWPSIASIAKKSRMTTRGVQKIVRQLEVEGWISISTGNGRSGCNQYRINPEPRSLNEVHPERSSPLNDDAKTLNEDAETLNLVPETLNGGSPEPSGTIKNRKEPSDARVVIDLLRETASVEAASSFIAYRRKHKAKALTPKAAQRVAKNLAEIRGRGGDADDALGMAEERGWATIEPDWYFRARGGDQSSQGPTSGRGHRATPAPTHFGGTW